MTVRARTYGPPRPVEHRRWRRRRSGRAWGNKYVGKAAILRQFIPRRVVRPTQRPPLTVTPVMRTKMRATAGKSNAMGDETHFLKILTLPPSCTVLAGNLKKVMWMVIAERQGKVWYYHKVKEAKAASRIPELDVRWPIIDSNAIIDSNDIFASNAAIQDHPVRKKKLHNLGRWADTEILLIKISVRAIAHFHLRDLGSSHGVFLITRSFIPV